MIRTLSRTVPKVITSKTKEIYSDWFSIAFSSLTITNFGFFAVLSIIAVYMVEVLKFSASEASMVMIMSSVGLRFSRPLIAPFINHIRPQIAMPAALLICAIGYSLLYFAKTPFAVASAMLLVGIGYGGNGMVITTLAAYGRKSSLNRYALMNMGTNIAAALSPPLSHMLASHISPQMPFVFSAIMLIVAIIISLQLPSNMPNLADNGDKWFRRLIDVSRKTKVRITLLITCFGWMIYTQKFSSMPLYVSGVLNHENLISSFFAINAGLIIVLSIPLSKIFSKYQWNNNQIVISAFLLYFVGFFVMYAMPSLVYAYTGFVILTVGEAILMPALNARMAESADDSEKLPAFSLAAIAVGIGEAIGNVSGINVIEYLKLGVNI